MTLKEDEKKSTSLTKEYLIRIRVDNIEIEVKGDKEFAEEKFGELKKEFLSLKALEDRMEKIEGVKVQDYPKITTSFVEFVTEKKPESHGNKIMCIAYWIRTNGKSFSVKDIDKHYTKAKWERPKGENVEIMWYNEIRRLIQRGFLEDAPEKDAKEKKWIILPKGIKYVENNFKKKMKNSRK